MSKTSTKTKTNTTVDTPKKREKAQPVMSLADVAKIQKKEKITTKSGMIRYLTSQNHSRAAIAATLNLRYQHVRNVLVEDELKAQNK